MTAAAAPLRLGTASSAVLAPPPPLGVPPTAPDPAPSLLPLPHTAASTPSTHTAPHAQAFATLQLARPHHSRAPPRAHRPQPQPQPQQPQQQQPTAAAAIRALSATLLLAAVDAASAAAAAAVAAEPNPRSQSPHSHRPASPQHAAAAEQPLPPSLARSMSLDARSDAGSSAAGADAEAAITDDGPAPVGRRVSLLSLPAELLHLIFAHLLPRAASSVYPAASWSTLPPTHVFIHLGAPQALRPLLALSLVCRTTRAVVRPLLYAAPTLERTRQARLLARTLALSPASAELAHSIRHLVFPQDGLLYASDQLADQQAWRSSLGAIFAAARELRSIWITTRPQGYSLAAFLAPDVGGRPRRVAINSFSPSPVPFHELDLSPLTQVTHLHLIQVLPAPELLALFAGQPQPAAPPQSQAAGAAPTSYASVAATRQTTPAAHGADAAAFAAPATGSSGVVLPQPPLTHLRLSSLPPFTLHDFSEYVSYRRALALHASLPASEAVQRRAPQAPTRTAASALKAQAALYDLAACVRRMPALRRLSLELSSLGALDEPEWAAMPGASAAAAALAAAAPGLPDGTGGPGSPYEASTGTLATLDFPSDVPVTLAEAREWAEREREQARADERSRTAQRDAYWLDVRGGLEALRELVAQAAGGTDVEVRLCAARPGGWDRHEARAESAAMIRAASVSSSSAEGSRSPARAAESDAHDARARASTSDGGLDDADDDGTAFSDPDIFLLAETRPLLGYQSSTASRRGSAQTQSAAAAVYTPTAAAAAVEMGREETRDERKTTLWWTGELPRINSGQD